MTDSKETASIKRRLKTLEDCDSKLSAIQKKQEEYKKLMQKLAREKQAIEVQQNKESLMYLGESIQATGFPMDKKSLLIGMALKLQDLMKHPEDGHAQNLLSELQTRYEEFAASKNFAP